MTDNAAPLCHMRLLSPIVRCPGRLANRRTPSPPVKDEEPKGGTFVPSAIYLESGPRDTSLSLNSRDHIDVTNGGGKTVAARISCLLFACGFDLTRHKTSKLALLWT